MVWRDFVGLWNFICRPNIHGMDCLKIFNFPAKKLRKNTGTFNYACANFLFSLKLTSVQMWLIFPPKDLENSAPKNTHAPFFFFDRSCTQANIVKLINFIFISTLSSFSLNKLSYETFIFRKAFICFKFSLITS